METLLFVFLLRKKKCVSTLHDEQPDVSFTLYFSLHIARGLFVFFGS